MISKTDLRRERFVKSDWHLLLDNYSKRARGAKADGKGERGSLTAHEDV